MQTAGLDMHGQPTAPGVQQWKQQPAAHASSDMMHGHPQGLPMGYDGASHQAGPPPDAGDASGGGGQRGNPGAGHAVSYPGAGGAAVAGGNSRAPEAEIKAGWLFKKAESSWGWRKRWSPPPPASSSPRALLRWTCCTCPPARHENPCAPPHLEHGPRLIMPPCFHCCGWSVDCRGRTTASTSREARAKISHGQARLTRLLVGLGSGDYPAREIQVSWSLAGCTW